MAGLWLKWLRANDLELLDPGRRECEVWFAEQRERGLSPATLRSRWIALGNLYGWLTDEEELDANPTAKVKVPKVVSQPIEMPTDADIAPGTATRISGTCGSGSAARSAVKASVSWCPGARSRQASTTSTPTPWVPTCRGMSW